MRLRDSEDYLELVDLCDLAIYLVDCPPLCRRRLGDLHSLIARRGLREEIGGEMVDNVAELLRQEQAVMPGVIVWIRDRAIACGMEAASRLGQTFPWPRTADDSSLILQALEEKLRYRIHDGTLTSEAYELVRRSLGGLSKSEDPKRSAELMEGLKRGLERKNNGDETRQRLLKELHARRN